MFYTNFEYLCRRKNTSPSAAAMYLGKSKNASAGWKKLGTIPKENELHMLATYLDCKVSDFFVDKVSEMSFVKKLEPLTLDLEEPQLTPGEEQLLWYYRGCNPKQKMELVSVVARWIQDNFTDEQIEASFA